MFERDHNANLAAALALVDEAIVKFPKFDKLYMMGGQLQRALLSSSSGDQKEGIKAAREYFARGTRACPHSSALWILSSRLEEEAGLTIRSRALLERARLLNPQSSTIWAESILVESRSSSPLPSRKRKRFSHGRFNSSPPRVYFGLSQSPTNRARGENPNGGRTQENLR